MDDLDELLALQREKLVGFMSDEAVLALDKYIRSKVRKVVEEIDYEKKKEKQSQIARENRRWFNQYGGTGGI